MSIISTTAMIAKPRCNNATPVHECFENHDIDSDSSLSQEVYRQ